jgi:hypothetical protein
MISWTLTLSGQQMALLKMFSKRYEGRDFYTRGQERESGVHPNTIPGTRTLVREGLLEHREVKDGNGYIVVGKSGHFITERGLFILAMVERDIDKFLSAEGQIASKRQKPRSLKKSA